MKKYLIFIFISTLMSLQAQWVLQNSGTAEDLNDTYCINADTVIVVGNNATILRTDDGGTNWTQISNPANVSLRKIDFIDQQTGFILGDNNVLLKTTDAGEHWQALNAVFVVNLHGLSCTDDKVFVSGENGKLYMSADLGNTWSSITTDTSAVLEIQMLDNSTGFSHYSAEILKTTDGGNTWTTVVCNNNTSFGIFDAGDQMAVAQVTGNNFCMSSDNFDTSETLAVPSFDTYSALKIIDANSFWLATVLPCGAPAVIKYEGEGDGFFAICNLSTLFTDESIGDFAVAPDSALTYAIGNNGLILKNPLGSNCNNYTVSLSDKPFDHLRIFPNPGQGLFRLSGLPESSLFYMITDSQGKKLTPLKELKHDYIRVNYLPEGVYFIHLLSPESFAVKKLIIEKR